MITGAAKRIGRAIAIDLFQHGFEVAIHYGQSREEALATAKECGGAPVFQADLANVQEIRRCFSEVRQQFGSLRFLVNNAARFSRFNPLEIEESDWDEIHSVNLKAVFFCCQEAAKQMMAGEGGRIVNISSLGGIRPWADHAHYGASKAGVIMLTKALAKAFAPRITVNSVAPGVILASDAEPDAANLIHATPIKRDGKPEEVAEAVRFFLTAPDFITGQILAVDGGLSQR